MHPSLPIAGLLLAWSLLAICRFPHGVLWTSTIVATEFGHFLALVAAGVGLWAWNSADVPGAVLALGAVLLFLTPHVRAMALHAGYSPTRLLNMSAPSAGAVATHTYAAADGSPLQLDLYPGPGAAPHPLMVSIHGGSWSGGDRTQLAGFNHHLAAQGFAVAAISYRLAPDHIHPAQIDDVEAAIQWLRDHAEELRIDASRPVLFGRSAGGHLATLAGLRAGRDKASAVIAFYPPADLVWGWHNPQKPRIYPSRETLQAFFGAPYDEAPERFVDGSPVTHVTAEAPPILTVHGSRDEYVSLTHARNMIAAAEAVGASYELVELPWATHGFDANPAGPGGQIALTAIERFLKTTR